MDDKARVRNRMADDAHTQVRLLKSEIENYGEYFWPGERQKIRTIIATYEKLIATIEGK